MSLKSAHTSNDLAALLNVPHDTLIRLAFRLPDGDKYSVMHARKRNGTPRIIRVPSNRLKMVQRRLLPLLEELYRPASHAHGYIPKRGLRSNAAPHIAKKYVLNVDLVDFFGAINLGRIRGRLLASPYNLTDAVATTISRLTTCDGSLPMGAPTSPILSNMLCTGLDAALTTLARNSGCFYSRYADDLTFSSNRRAFPAGLAVRSADVGSTITIAGPVLSDTILHQGFVINSDKTRLLYPSDRQEVCGIVCNERLNTLPKLRRQIRAALHAWRKFGLTNAETEWNEKYNFRKSQGFEASLRGKIEFVKHIRGETDKIVVSFAKQFNELRTPQMSPISFTEIKDWRAELHKTAVCIEGYMGDNSSEMHQGSGFLIKGGLIVTNYHAVAHKDNIFAEIVVFHPAKKSLKFNGEVVAVLPKEDLALLKVTDDLWSAYCGESYCEVSDAPAGLEDIVWLTGWPSYQDGDELHCVQSQVIGFASRKSTTLFRIGTNVVEGNSGGAVFNELGAVVGIATFGSDALGAKFNVFNGCLPASLIAKLVSQLPVS